MQLGGRSRVRERTASTCAIVHSRKSERICVEDHGSETELGLTVSDRKWAKFHVELALVR